METVRWVELMSDEQWDNEARSDIEFKTRRDQLRKDARKRCNDDPDKKSRMIPHPDVELPVPRTEASLTLKLANKKPKSKRSKESLDGLCEVLAPISSVIKSNEHFSIIKEPGRRQVTVSSSDLAKLGTKPEKQSYLKCYAERRPKVPTGKTSEELISRHAEGARKKMKAIRRLNTDVSLMP